MMQFLHTGAQYSATKSHGGNAKVPVKSFAPASQVMWTKESGFQKMGFVSDGMVKCE